MSTFREFRIISKQAARIYAEWAGMSLSEVARKGPVRVKNGAGKWVRFGLTGQLKWAVQPD
jgi:hypothetical protein